MKIENLRDKMLASHSEATTQEIECLKTYYDEADKHGHFDTYYKVWSTEKIEKLESQNRKLKEKLKEATNILKDGCQVYDQHVPSGSSSFRSDAQWFLDTGLKEVENEIS